MRDLSQAEKSNPEETMSPDQQLSAPSPQIEKEFEDYDESLFL